MTPVRFALAVALFLVATGNLGFWQRTAQALWYPSWTLAAFFAALAILLVLLPMLVLLLLPASRPLKAGAIVLVLVASVAGYFMDRMGSPMTAAMMRNVLETDSAEVQDLINGGMLLRVALLGVLPAVLITRLTIIPMGGWRGAGRRLGTVVVLIALLAGCLSVSAPVMAVFLREHKVLRAYANPVAPIWNFFAALQAKPAIKGPLINPAPAVPTRKAGDRTRVFVLVLGETARAANFGLGGYSRDTTPRLRQRTDITYFPSVESCGTSTAESVPCMFSHLGREGARKDQPERYETLLDTLVRAGVRVIWLDNNSGCKGVCARVPTIDLGQAPVRERHGDLCAGMHCLDEALDRELQRELAAIATDTLIVMHQIGSHGPAYTERYPAAFQRYQPVCALADLSRCDRQSLINAYDNTILYTDHNVALNIESLQRESLARTTMLLYVSDHGESLGENGMYLHGLPRSLAPAAQTQVPMVAWLSENFRQADPVGSGCLAKRATSALSHDNLYHTVAGFFGITQVPYQPALDMLAPCT